MGFLAGKRILITGLISNRSIAYGIAKACHREGAELAFTYQNERFKDRMAKYADEFGSTAIYPCDVSPGCRDRCRVRRAGASAGTASTAWCTRSPLRPTTQIEGRLSSTASRARASISRTRSAVLQLSGTGQGGATELMKGNKRALLALSYLGAVRTMPNYNTMGLAKASLEACVRYLAFCLGPQGIRANALSAGPIKTLAASGIGNFGKLLAYNAHHAPTAPQRDGRGSRQRRRLPALRPRQRRHRRNTLRGWRHAHHGDGQRGPSAGLIHA
jgi:enoyl-[acyl-carrier protein] reductase I